MATSIVLNFFLLCLLLFSASPTLSASNELPKTGFITLPVKKDPATNQYYTSIGIGTPNHKLNLAIDLAGEFLWYDCDTRYNSSSYLPVPCDTQKCPQNSPCIGCNGFPTKPGCTNNTCGLSITNPFADTIFSGDMGEDLLHIPQIKVPRSFASGCADSDRFSTPLLVGLAKGTKGILGLARSQLSLPTQISSSYNVPPKFTLCLPSSNTKGTGKIFIGGRPSSRANVARIGFALTSSEEYFINVKSIMVDDKVVNFDTSLLSLDKNGNGGTKISTLGTPYTVLHNSIYKPFVRDFVKKASDRKIKRVKSVAPFEACFDAGSIDDLDMGPAVPVIELLFDGGLKYEMFGHNTMVEVKEKVLCLAFVDGGKKAKNAVVLGGRQLEDKILEFDLSTSILTFSSSLLLQGETCSDPVLN
ncbi:probable aspartic proteinase GIP2 [Lotus japonicus]|uniref:probable aspartic proteinase GIP2 n=1 Tax=Lotus japonicus TaxID=34305 RepID=UPI002585753F|nr:probable aspartic proteinase GIP2 [Lotus japonicus]